MEFLLHAGMFLLASFLVALEPGPGFIKLADKTVHENTRSAVTTAFGMFFGAVPCIILIATGTNWLASHIPNLLTILKCLGAAYLLWLGISLLKQRDSSDHMLAGLPETKPVTAYSASFLDGFLLVLLNPRTPVFYSAFLPLFVMDNAFLSLSTQLIVLGTSVSTVFLTVDILFVLAIRKYKNAFTISNKTKNLILYLGALLLVVFGARMVSDRD